MRLLSRDALFVARQRTHDAVTVEQYRGRLGLQSPIRKLQRGGEGDDLHALASANTVRQGARRLERTQGQVEKKTLGSRQNDVV
jgi:hypothetical protein